MNTRTETILAPKVAAARLGLTTAGLTALIRAYRYPFTELRPGGKPGDRSHHRWGLTEAQLAAIVRGQERGFAEPEPEPAAPVPSKASPDGVSRLRRGGRARA